MSSTSSSSSPSTPAATAQLVSPIPITITHVQSAQLLHSPSSLANQTDSNENISLQKKPMNLLTNRKLSNPGSIKQLTSFISSKAAKSNSKIANDSTTSSSELLNNENSNNNEPPPLPPLPPPPLASNSSQQFEALKTQYEKLIKENSEISSKFKLLEQIHLDTINEYDKQQSRLYNQIDDMHLK